MVKRDKTKIQAIKDAITYKDRWLFFSDGRIAQRFGVSVESVKKLRQRLGLKKDYGIRIMIAHTLQK